MIQFGRNASMLLVLVVVLLGILVPQPIISASSTQSILLGVIAALLAVLVLEPMNKTAEYKIVPAGTLDQKALDEAGKQGWQLVLIDASTSSYVFKR